jgi:hypothetical protein
LSVEYQCGNTNSSSQQIQPYFKIANTGSTAVSLSTLKVRYFFTGDGSATQDFACDYALMGCGNLSAAFASWGGGGADHYLEVSFSGGSVPAGGDCGPIQARFYDSNYLTFNQTNDYSFDPTKASYVNWTHMTLYQNGTLVWGTEP